MSTPTALLQELVRVLSSGQVLPIPARIQIVYRGQVVALERAARAVVDGYTVAVVAVSPANGGELLRVAVSRNAALP